MFNHTDEGNELGPTQSFRGIDNRTFYLLDPNNPAAYAELQRHRQHRSTRTTRCRRSSSSIACGTGWRRCTSMASGSTRARFSRAGEDGAPLVHPPVIWQIELDDALADTKLIAEAWDAAGLYQVGHFPGRPLGRVERPLSRRRSPVRERRSGPDRRHRVAPRRQRRHLSGARADAGEQHQLRDRPRRLHAQRPRLVQRQAQRGERRRQPRRHRREPELELRRRGAHGRPGDRGAAHAADQELRRPS